MPIRRLCRRFYYKDIIVKIFSLFYADIELVLDWYPLCFKGERWWQRPCVKFILLFIYFSIFSSKLHVHSSLRLTVYQYQCLFEYYSQVLVMWLSLLAGKNILSLFRDITLWVLFARVTRKRDFLRTVDLKVFYEK